MLHIKYKSIKTLGFDEVMVVGQWLIPYVLMVQWKIEFNFMDIIVKYIKISEVSCYV